MAIRVRRARLGDIEAMVRLISQARAHQERVEPVFWRRAGHAQAATRWFYGARLMFWPRTLALVAEDERGVRGFLIGERTRPPPVYAPGGLTLVIDDFHVAAPEAWAEAGQALLSEAREAGRRSGCRQIVVVCVARDATKSDFLRSADLSLVSQWWSGPA